MADKTDGVLAVLADIWSRGLVGENALAFEQARAKVAELLRVAEQIGDKYVHGEGTDEEVEEWNSAIRAMRGDE